jgi:hypothetical protein
LQSSPLASTKAIVKQAIQLLNNEVLKSASNMDLIKNIKDNPNSLNKLASSVDAILSKLSSQIKDADAIFNPKLLVALEKLQHQMQTKLLTPENFKLESIKESLNQVSMVMQKSFTIQSKWILGALDKIFQSLKGDISLENFIEKKLPQDIINLTKTIDAVIQKADPIFSKEVTLLSNRLQTLNTSTKLSTQNGVKEIISNDLKSVLMQANEEISKSSHPKQTELLKHIDKLSLQIDNYQLISHLSNASSLYLPFSWDSLQEGNIEIQKAKDNKFFCDINLKLKEYGELNLKLTLYEKNQLNIHIYTSNEKFKELVKENIPSLRSALIDTKITPREIRIFEPKKPLPVSPYQIQSDALEMGFEVKA